MSGSREMIRPLWRFHTVEFMTLWTPTVGKSDDGPSLTPNLVSGFSTVYVDDTVLC
jgi:hypothetical protein